VGSGRTFFVSYFNIAMQSDFSALKDFFSHEILSLPPSSLYVQ